jgi:hypothetical protein
VVAVRAIESLNTSSFALFSGSLDLSSIGSAEMRFNDKFSDLPAVSGNKDCTARFAPPAVRLVQAERSHHD